MLISVVAARFYMEGIMQCKEKTPGATMVRAGTAKASINRNVKDLFWWSAVPKTDKGLNAWMFRLATIAHPGWVRTYVKSGQQVKAYGRTQRHETMHAVVDAILRVGQDDWRSPMLCSGGVVSESSALVQARMMGVPASVDRPGGDAGLYVSPMLLLVPQHCLSALHSFLCTRELAKAFDNMPLLQISAGARSSARTRCGFPKFLRTAM